MLDKKGYLESLVDDDLQRFIITHLDEDPEVLIDLCIEYIEGRDNDA